MAARAKSPSETPMPSIENAKDENVQTDGGSAVTEEEFNAMQTILDAIYDYKDTEGQSPAYPFLRMVNKRAVPDYYNVIKEPVALSSIKQKIAKRDYKAFSEFVRDFALVSHNAQVYNRPEAGVYQNAVQLKAVLEAELKKIVDEKIVTAEAAALPDLGEIPPPSPRAPDEEGEDDEDEDEDEEDDEVDESDDEGTRKRRRRGPRSTAAITKREGGSKAEDNGQKGTEADARKRRGRPPRVDTPMEARIKAVLKGMRKFKHPNGDLKVNHFERLPDKSHMPEYFAEIKVPMALDVIKRKAKRKKYQSVDHFMKDVEIMFDNAQSYNLDDSQIYKDAVELQKESRLLAEQEKKKPDSDYVMEDGRLPLPNGILHNGELWKVGDWVHIQNPNDLTKPIVAQIYRTWQDAEGQKWVNACWYYRPEQTVHRAERHFFEHEVVKTGQYRDHHIDEVVDRCFVMFFTRFNKGRPRGFPPEKDVYVCESRYNEEKHKLNKIKTWASCLPDEVREKDYEMDLFDAPKKMKKVPSPIKHLLPENAKEADDLPKPTWGVENAPPIVGAVHLRPREANESPPPEPTPTPPPQPPPRPARQISSHSAHVPDTQGDINMTGTTPVSAQATPAHPHFAAHPPNASQYHGNSASPAPAFNPSAFTSLPPHLAHANQYSTPQSSQLYHSQNVQRTASGQYDATRAHLGTTAAGGSPYVPPKPSEVYMLNDSANFSIPPDVRERYHRDAQGRILFFTAPPLDVGESKALGHSVRYLAEKARRMREIMEKRKAKDTDKAVEEQTAKRIKIEEDVHVQVTAQELQEAALLEMARRVDAGTRQIIKRMYGDRWKEGELIEAEKLRLIQGKEASRKADALTERAQGPAPWPPNEKGAVSKPENSDPSL